MAEIPLGLSFDEDDNGFVLRRKESDGAVNAIHITREEFFGLKTTIGLWSDRILQASQAQSGSVHAAVAYPIERVGLMIDALRANVLAILEAPSGERMIASLAPAVASHLLELLPGVLAQIETDRPIRQ